MVNIHRSVVQCNVNIMVQWSPQALGFKKVCRFRKSVDTEYRIGVSTIWHNMIMLLHLNWSEYIFCSSLCPEEYTTPTPHPPANTKHWPNYWPNYWWLYSLKHWTGIVPCKGKRQIGLGLLLFGLCRAALCRMVFVGDDDCEAHILYLFWGMRPLDHANMTYRNTPCTLVNKCFIIWHFYTALRKCQLSNEDKTHMASHWYSAASMSRLKYRYIIFREMMLLWMCQVRFINHARHIFFSKWKPVASPEPVLISPTLISREKKIVCIRFMTEVCLKTHQLPPSP